METMRAIRAIKLHGHETMRENGWRNRYAEVISAAYRRRIADIKLDLAEEALFGISFLLTVYFGAVAVIGLRARKTVTRVGVVWPSAQSQR